MEILLLLIITYCIYLHYKLSERNDEILELIDDYRDMYFSDLEGELNAIKKQLKKLKDKKCCNEKPRRKPAKIRSRLLKTKIPKD